MFCTICAQPIPNNATSCSRCGATLDGWDRPVSPGTPATRYRLGTRSRTRLLRALYVVTALALALSAGAGLVEASDLRQRQSAAYEEGQQAFARGDLLSAESSFADAGGFADAPTRLQDVRAALRPLTLAYDAGAAALAAGDADAAIAHLSPVATQLPEYRDTTLLLEQARSISEAADFRRATGALSGGDWLTAELLLSQLHQLDPENLEIAALLQTLRSDHPVLLHTQGKDLMLSSLDGREPVVIVDEIPAALPVWSPDRTRIAFVSPGYGTRSLYVVNTDGTGLLRLAAEPGRRRPPVWSPDSVHLAFEVDGPSTENTSGRETVLIANAVTGVVEEVTGGQFDNAHSPTWSPEGDRLAFVVRAPSMNTTSYTGSEASVWDQDHEIYIKNLATGAFTLVDGPAIRLPWRIMWSPAGPEIAVYSRADGTSFRQGTLSVINTTTGAVQDIDRENLDVTMPVWSPDGLKLAYTAHGTELHVVGVDGSRSVVTPPDSITGFVTWSPSSDQLLVGGSIATAGAFLVDFTGPSSKVSFVSIRFDGDGGDPGPLQWSPASLPVSRATSRSGDTAFDSSR